MTPKTTSKEVCRSRQGVLSERPAPGSKDGESTAARNKPDVWFAALSAIAGSVWLLLVVSGGLDLGSSLTAVAWGMLTPSFGVSAVAGWRRRRSGSGQLPSPEELYSHVDTDALRAVRDGRGRATAAHDLRRRLPNLSLTAAVKFIDEL